MDYDIVIEFPFVIPSANVTKRWQSYKWRPIKDKIHTILFDYCYDHQVARIEGFVIGEYIRYSKKKLDRDNLYTTAKYIMDAFVDYQIIEDDDDAHLLLTCKNGLYTGKPKTVVKLKKAPPPGEAILTD